MINVSDVTKKQKKTLSKLITNSCSSIQDINN